MSLADLSSKLYTIKSRRNVPISTAFVSMIREDLAMRYSVFNIIKSITGSELIAQVAESKYGFKTPLQKEEEAREKKKISKEKRFKQFTVNSLVTLNNKVNTLSALTERNTTLIENLYNDLGSFRNQKKFTKREMNSTTVKPQIKSRTVKFQIDQIRAELNALQMITIGPKGSKKLKKAAESDAGITTSLKDKLPPMVPIGASTPPGSTPGSSPDAGAGSSSVSNVIDTVSNILLGKQISDWWNNRAPSATKIPATPPAPIAPATGKPPIWNAKLQRWQDPMSGKIVKPPTPTTTTASTTTASKAAGALSTTKSFLGGLIKGSIVGEIAMQLGPKNLDRLAGAFQKQAAETKSAANEIAAKYGLKLIQGPGGATIGYEIDGVRYNNFNDLPIEYQNIINAYISPDRVAKQKALGAIAASEATYKLLETREGRMQVLPPPVAEESAASIIAAAKAAELAVSTPQMIESAEVKVEKPKFFQRGPAPASPTSAPVSSGDMSGTTSSSSAAASSAPSSATIATSPIDPGLPIDFLAFSKKIAELESAGAGGYNAVNTLGYLGKYQFGALALQDMGLVKRGTKQNQLDDSKNWILKGGKQAFLSDPQLQEQSFAKLTKQNYKTLQRMNILSVDSTPYQVAGFLAVSHLLGPGGALNLVKGKDKKDAYGTSASKYFTAGVQTQKMYVLQVSRDAGQPLLTVATGAAVSVPPTASSAAAPSATETPVTDPSGKAALIANRVVQDKVVALAGKVSDINKQVQMDRSFPSVRNSSSV